MKPRREPAHSPGLPTLVLEWSRPGYPREHYIYQAGSGPTLNELYRIAIRIGDPRGAQFAVKKVMRRRKQRSALGDQCAHGGISVVGPKNDFDPAPFLFWTKAVVLSGRLQRRNSESEPIQSDFDVGCSPEAGVRNVSTKPSSE